MTCAECGVASSTGVKFCASCGTQLGGPWSPDVIEPQRRSSAARRAIVIGTLLVVPLGLAAVAVAASVGKAEPVDTISHGGATEEEPPTRATAAEAATERVAVQPTASGEITDCVINTSYGPSSPLRIEGTVTNTGTSSADFTIYAGFRSSKGVRVTDGTTYVSSLAPDETAGWSLVLQNNGIPMSYGTLDGQCEIFELSETEFLGD